MAERIVHIPSIACEHCTRTIERELAELEGVTSVEADVATRTVRIEWDEPTEWGAIRALLEEIGHAPD